MCCSVGRVRNGFGCKADAVGLEHDPALARVEPDVVTRLERLHGDRPRSGAIDALELGNDSYGLA